MRSNRFLPISFALIILAFSSVFGQEPNSTEVGFAGCWSYPTNSGAGSRLAADGQNLFFGHRKNTVEALSKDGAILWRSDLGGEISSNMLVTNESLILVTRNRVGDEGSFTSQLRSLSKATGITVWAKPIADSHEHFLESDGNLLIIASRNGILQSFDPVTSVVKWKREPTNSFSTAPAIGDRRIVVASEGGQIFSVLIENVATSAENNTRMAKQTADVAEHLHAIMNKEVVTHATA